jgi:hypothetical protein
MSKYVRYKASPPEVVLGKNANTYRRLRRTEQAAIAEELKQSEPWLKFSKKMVEKYGGDVRQVYRDLDVIFKANQLDEEKT